MDHSELRNRLRAIAFSSNVDDFVNVKNSASWEQIFDVYPDFLDDVFCYSRWEFALFLIDFADFPVEYERHGCTIVETFLYLSSDEDQSEVLEKLLLKGANFNFIYSEKGQQKLKGFIGYSLRRTELIRVLLHFGLDVLRLSLETNVYIFECAVLLRNDFVINKICSGVFKQNRIKKLSLNSLKYLAYTKNEFFFDILKIVDEVGFFENSSEVCFRSDNLKQLTENLECPYWESLITKMFVCLNCSSNARILVRTPINDIKTLIEGNVGCHILNYLKHFRGDHLVVQLLIMYAPDETKILEYLKLFVSYGTGCFGEASLHYTYNHFGYSKLFEYILDVGVVIDYDDQTFVHRFMRIMPKLIYDPKADIIQSLRNRMPDEKVSYLLHYSNLEEVRNTCTQRNSKKLEKLPRLPLLQEFARNQTREFLVDHFNIQQAKEFHYLIKNLPIPKKIQDVLTFKLPLYYKFLNQK